MDISPSSSLDIIDEYTEAEVTWFIEQIQKSYDTKSIINEMTFVNNLIMANGAQTKKGNKYYANWQRSMTTKIEQINEPNTLFNRLKRARKKRTVFDNLKDFKRNS